MEGLSETAILSKSRFPNRHVTPLGTSAYAQNNIVSGKVSYDNGDPMTGVSVMIQGTKTGTITDINGNYSLNALPNATLQFSYIGMTTQTIAIAGRTVINVS